MSRGMPAARSTSWRWLAMVLVVVLVSWTGAVAAQDAQLLSVLRNLDPDFLPFPSDVVRSASVRSARSERIDPLLLALADDVASRGRSLLAESAGALQVGVRDDLVEVELIAEDAFGREELEWRVEDEGGLVTATFDNVVLADLPVDRIEAFGGDAALYYMTAQARFSYAPPDVGALSGGRGTDGVRAIAAERLHAEGITGRGVKVGILDFGFQGYDALVRRGALPRPVAQRAFNRSGRLENGSVHGTACAEIVHAVAPDAELYLAAVGEGGSASSGEIVQAVQWLAAQDLDIISFSGGGHGGPHNGRALLDRLVDDIVARTGVLWVNAAGNEGDSHWGGSAADRDGDGLIEVDGRRAFVAVQPSSQGVVALMVNWDDWGADARRPAASQDIDAFLFETVGRGQPRLVARSTNPQRGRGRPMELVQHRARRSGAVYVLALRASRLDRPVRLHVYNLAGGPMQPKDATGSIGIPATARGALAVGAVAVGTDRLEAFSSQGPTDDDRIKPLVVAPDRTRSAAYRDVFPGTSAACPHVAGFAALLKQITPSADREDLTEMVRRHVRPLGGGGTNNRSGYGHIDASDVPLGVTTDGFIELPGFLGGSTSVRALDALWDRAEERTPRLGLRVRVDRRPERRGEPPRYRIGDEMKVGFATDERCRYALILRDARGEYRVIQSSELYPDEPQLLPEGDDQYLHVTEPVGDEGFLLVCAQRKVDVEDWRGRDNARDARDVEVAIAEFRVER